MSPSINITWVTQRDDRVCPICQQLEGYTWTFTDEQVPRFLNQNGKYVWDEFVGSLAHGHKGTCRCHLKCTGLDLSDIKLRLQQLLEYAKAATGEGEQT